MSNQPLKIAYTKISDLIPYARNSRTHNDAQVAQIAASIREFGFTNPILTDESGGIIAGHGRVMAARKLGMAEVPTITLAGLTETQKRAYVIADNKLALNAGWDEEALQNEMQALSDASFDLSLTGFDAAELSALLDKAISTDGLTDEDAVPETPEQPVTRHGDVWLLCNHRLMCGDSTSIDAVEKLMDGQKADMVFTDPPYGYSYESNHQSKHDVLLNDDKILDFMPAAFAVMAENSAIYVCGSHQTIHEWRKLVDQNFTYKNLIVWKKNNWSMGDLSGAFAGQHELIIFAHKGRVTLRGERSRDVWEFDREPPSVHPTQKPIALVQMAVEKVSDKNGIVLDLFGGSGSTLIACEKTGRQCRLMELDQKYCDVIVKRWQDFTGKKATHAETGKTFEELSNGRN